MKVILYQVKSFRWKSWSKTLDHVEDIDVEQSVQEAVVAFVHAEEADVENPKVATKLVKNIKWLANKGGFKNVALHSFTHLSSSTAPPHYAVNLLNSVAQRLEQTGYQVSQTPFGYFCEWDLSVYGQSLAKVFKEF